MIEVKVTTDSPGRSRCISHLDGSLEELVRDTAYALNAIFNGIVKDAGPVQGILFQRSVCALVEDIRSPVWELKKSVNEAAGKEGQS